MLFTGLTLLGYISYKHLAIELYPTAELPMLFVQVNTMSSADPHQVEQQAIIPLEGTIGQLNDVSTIESIASAQNGRIRVSYEQGTNMKYAYLRLVEKIEARAKTLPEGYRVQVIKFDMQQINNVFMTLQAMGSGGVDRVRNVVDKDILDQLQSIDGIANAEVYGGRQKSVQIELNQEICEAHGLTPNHIRNALNTNNQPKVFVGNVNRNNQFHTVNVSSELNDIEEIRELVVKEKGPVRLKDIAEINFGVKEQTSYSRINGKESVTIRLTKTSDANLIKLSGNVRKVVEQINTDLSGSDIELAIASNTADTMEENINMIIMLAITGGLLAIFVLWIFLKNIRLVATISLAIPVSVFTAFNFFYAFDITINSFTLMGIALAVGMLLDSSIVVMENIYRLAAKNHNIDSAVVTGTKEVWRSIVAATLTTIMVFLPFAFSENPFVKLLGKNIGVSVVSMLLVSLVVSLLLVPMITHAFLKKTKGVKFENFSIHNRFVQVYLTFLKSALRKPAGTVIGALVIFFVILMISLGLNLGNSESTEATELTLFVKPPEGSTLESTDMIISEVEKKLLELEEGKEIISQVYEKEATIKIKLKENYGDIRNISIAKLKQDILVRVNKIGPAEYSFYAFSGGERFNGGDAAIGAGLTSMLGMRSENEKITLKGQDFEKMLSIAENIKYHLSEQEDVQWTHISAPSKSPELHLDFDKYLMAMFNISQQSIVAELATFPEEINAGATLNVGLDKYDIIIKSGENKPEKDEKAERTLDDLKKVNIKSADNLSFELQEISRFDYSRGLTAINRTNQAKYLEIYYAFLEEVSSDKDLLKASQTEVDLMINKMAVPSDIAIEVIHDDRDFNDFPFLILASIIFIYMILASVFESFVTPVVLLFSIPLAAIGSLGALILTGSSLLNFVTLIGFIILLGIVVNNGIIIIDYTRILKKKGSSPEKALVVAGLARVRPILITAITTIIALFPMALGKAEYVSQIGVPFAITVIGGLALSTVLTLVFIPTINSGLSSSLNWIYSRSLPTKVIMFSLCLMGFYFIYAEVDSLLWQIIDFLLLVILVPAVTWFIQNSLRKANEQIIDPDKPIVIKIRNLVKIYDWDSRFVRDWKSGIKIRRRLGIKQEITTWKDLDRLLWQLPLVAFAFYFVYFYLESGFWQFILPIGMHMLALNILNPVREFFVQRGKNWNKKIANTLYKLVFWGYPAVALLLLKNKFPDLIALIIIIAIFWYLSLLIKLTSDKLYGNNTNINRLKGKFKGPRKTFYRFVLAIPLIGKKKKPFKALKGISLEITHGMFGLLGPNGAGKSTLMRIICGLLEPSYGQITINGIDVKEKREELQGLIGYLPQEFGMYENMTAWNFLQYMAIMKKIVDKAKRDERVSYALKAVHMYDTKDKNIGSFSGGMRQRIGIALILLHLPRILVVDEPTSGLDPRERIRFRNLLVELSKERIVIFSTHVIEDVASSCNKVAVVKEGEVKYLGAPVQMARLANGKVWMAEMTLEEFITFKENHVIIHHMLSGELVKVRCLADVKPHESAKLATANLEDAYLYLLYQLKSVSKNEKESASNFQEAIVNL